MDVSKVYQPSDNSLRNETIHVVKNFAVKNLHRQMAGRTNKQQQEKNEKTKYTQMGKQSKNIVQTAGVKTISKTNDTFYNGM